MNPFSYGKFPAARPRRVRKNEAIRRLVRETHFSLDQLVMPYFVRPGTRIREEITAMPGQFRFSVDTLLEELEELKEAGIRNILLFGLPSGKDDQGSEAWSREGIIQKALREITRRFPDMLAITDLCLCAYTKHGHCGVLNAKGGVDNDATLKLLAEAAVAQAEAGAGMIAPSDMMDGRIRAIREALDHHGHKELPIMSYSAKYASAFYGPFREAAHSAPGEGDRKGYQMDPANRTEALREIGMDIDEGADIVMVKPGLPYLDVIREAASVFNFPLAAYSVSGEYSMIKAAAEKGLVDERKAVEELCLSFSRAGARVLISYYAKQIGFWRNSEIKPQVISKKQVKYSPLV